MAGNTQSPRLRAFLVVCLVVFSSLTLADSYRIVTITHKKVVSVDDLPRAYTSAKQNATKYAIIKSIPVEFESYGMALDPANGYIYVAGDGGIVIINGSTNEVIKTVYNPLSMEVVTVGGIAYDPSNGLLYLAAQNLQNMISGTVFGGGIVMYNAANMSVVGAISPISDPNEVQYDPVNQYLYFQNGYPLSVGVINTITNKWVMNISVGGPPSAITYVPTNGYIYVSVQNQSKLSVIDGSTNKVISNISVGNGTFSSSYDPNSRFLYVANFFSDNVSVVDVYTNRVVGNINLASFGLVQPYQVLYDPLNGLLIVMDSYPNQTSPYAQGLVTLVNTSTLTVLSNITPAKQIASLFFDHINGLIYAPTYFGPFQVYVIGEPIPNSGNIFYQILLKYLPVAASMVLIAAVAVYVVNNRKHKRPRGKRKTR